MSDKNPVENNHFIPCYWTAYWNIEYLNSKRKKEKTNSPRDIEVSYFNLKANKILKGKTKTVFLDKYRGLATIEVENDLKKIQNNFIICNTDEEYQSYGLILDFENHFTEYENLSRDALERTIITKKIKNIEDKTFLAQFFILQSIRNPQILNKRLDYLLNNGKNKLDLLLEVREVFTNRKKLESLIVPLVYCKWKIYSVKDNLFPIPDKSILDNKNHIFVPLAPDILIEIQLNNKTEKIASYHYKISKFKYIKFKNRVIKNINTEIVANTDLLKKWRNKI